MPRMSLEDPATERSVLGAIIRDSGLFEEHRARLTPDLFMNPLNRRIFLAIKALVDQERKISAPAVSSRAKREGDEISVEGYVATLIADNTDASIASDLIDDLIEMHARRMLAEHGQACIEEATRDGMETAQERVDRALARTRWVGELAAGEVESADIIVERVIDQAASAYRDQRSQGWPWLLREAANVTGGELEPGWLVGLLASSGDGKTSLALQQAKFSAEDGTPVLFFSGDQPPEDCYRQLAAQQLGIESGNIRRGGISEAEFNAFAETLRRYRRLPMRVVKMGRPTTSWISNQVRTFARRMGKGLVIIDHAKRIAFDDKRSILSEGINQIYGDLKALMLSVECCGVVLMQRNSDGSKRDNPRPFPSDIYGGDGAKENFDTVLALYVEERWLAQKIKGLTGDRAAALDKRLNEVRGRAELIGLKARFGPDGLDVMIKREARFTRFSSLKTEQQAQAEML